MESENLLKVTEVAKRLNIGGETVRRWIRSGRLRAIRLGGRLSQWRIRESDLAQFLDSELNGG